MGSVYCRTPVGGSVVVTRQFVLSISAVHACTECGGLHYYLVSKL